MYKNSVSRELDGSTEEGRLWWRRFARWIGREPVHAATLLGLFFYAALRVSLFVFYASLRVSPEEVGHGYSSTVSQAVVGTILVFLFILSVLATVAVLGFAAVAPTIIMFRKFQVIGFAWLIGTVGLATTIGLVFSLPGPFRGGTIKEIVTIASLTWWCLGLLFDDFDDPLTVRLTLVGVKKLAPPISLLVVVAGLFILMPAAARLDAHAVADGHARAFAICRSPGISMGCRPSCGDLDRPTCPDGRGIRRLFDAPRTSGRHCGVLGPGSRGSPSFACGQDHDVVAHRVLV